MKKIICPTDFSEAAQNAVAYAAKLAQATHCDLTLLNVQSMFDLTPSEVIRGKEATIAGVAERLETQCREVSKAFKISCYAEVESGFSRLSSVIHDKAKGYDLIVMGTDGPDDLYQFFSGSNTYNTIVQSKTPLLLIPAGYGYNEIKTMVYAFDYLRERNLPLADLLPLIKVLNCELTVLQVMEEAYSKYAEDDLKELQLILSSFYADDLNFKYDTVRSSEVAQSINSYILRNQPDVLAMCSIHNTLFQRIFHKSVIKNVTAFSSYPVLVFHP